MWSLVLALCVLAVIDAGVGVCRQQVQIIVEKLFLEYKDVLAFRTSLQDFLVQIKVCVVAYAGVMCVAHGAVHACRCLGRTTCT